MKNWLLIFKALSNINRLKMIKLLQIKKTMNVSDISTELNISIQATSRHLNILQNFSILDSVGKDGHVWYSLNPSMPKNQKKALSLIL